jgi:hypothetical protein
MDCISKEQLLLNTLVVFFNKNNNLDNILPIINSESILSLRILDGFVTNYARDYNIIYQLNNVNFNVYKDYKLQLKAYNKRYFDPFSRGNRIKLEYNNKIIITTIGQLNFFRWALTNNIIEYVTNNYDAITKEMNLAYKNAKLRNSESSISSTITEDNTETFRQKIKRTKDQILINKQFYYNLI